MKTTRQLLTALAAVATISNLYSHEIPRQHSETDMKTKFNHGSYQIGEVYARS